MGNLEIAEKHLLNANYSNCFEFLDKVEMSQENQLILNRLRREFISGGNWDFGDRLYDFIKTLKK